ncbi:MAG: hypothetical protein ACKO25_04670, partial [Cyanobium sp.]
LEKGDIHEWTKTVAVVVAALWGIYTFVWKDILVPSWAPASLVIEVTDQPERPKPSADVRQPAGTVSMRFQVTVTNPTQRPLYLLPNVWWASSIKRQAAAKKTTFETAANAVLSQPSVAHAERGQELVSSTVLATGRLFPDDQIQPGEKLSSDLSITLPNATSAVAFQLIVPALTRNPRPTGGLPSRLFGGRRMSWAYSEQADTVYPLLCQQAAVAAKGAGCEPVETILIKQMIKTFDQGAVIFFKSNLISY